jgi:hypothetical protein
MQLTALPAGYPRPATLPALAVTPKIDLGTDVVELDGTGNRVLPRAIGDNLHLDIRTTTLDYEGEPILDWFAADSDYENAYRMTRGGFSAALAAAQLLSPRHEAIAVVEAAKTGTRYLVPLGVWDPVDESMLGFDEVGGTPYWNGAKDHMLMRSTGAADVEAVVFNDGTGWLNTTGHPVKLPTA